MLILTGRGRSACVNDGAEIQDKSVPSTRNGARSLSYCDLKAPNDLDVDCRFGSAYWVCCART